MYKFKQLKKTLKSLRLINASARPNSVKCGTVNPEISFGTDHRSPCTQDCSKKCIPEVMTHLLPPNLLKLFSPRPPLPYVRPPGKDLNQITAKQVSGVAGLLSQIREENANAIVADGKEAGEAPEEDNFTYVEEIKRQIRREERAKKRLEAFKKAKETCTLLHSIYP
jgi:hypothetical protein